MGMMGRLRTDNGESVVLVGKSDLCEIAILCAVGSPTSVVAVVDPDKAASRFIGVGVVPRYADVVESFAAVVVTHLMEARSMFDQAVETFGLERVLAPDLLGLRPSQEHGA